MRPVRIVVFAKAPQPGAVKTRLIPALGAEKAARLAQKMLNHTVRESLSAGVDAVELCVSPSPESEDWVTFRPQNDHLLWSDQGNGDLGERLSRTAERIISEGASPVFIGTDCPDLNRQTLAEAAEQLRQHDAVMIPSTDGGYVLLGLNHFNTDIFRNIAWSTDSVASTTLQRMEELMWTVMIMPHMRDIDEPVDLEILPADWKES